MPGRVLITGATGFVGGWVTEALLQAGYEVTHLGRKAHHNPSVSNLLADITDKEALTQELQNKLFDTVIHLAAADQRQGSDKLFAVNYHGTQHLLDALKGNPSCKFIYPSSIKVYPNLSGIATEETPVSQGNTTYGDSKAAAERLVLELAPNHLVLRLSNAYGAPTNIDVEAWHLLFNDLCRSAYEKGEISLKSPPDTLLDMVWMGSVCQVILQAIANDSIKGIYNLGSANTIAIGEVAQAVARAYKSYFGKTLLVNMPPSAGNASAFTFNCAKLQSVAPYDTNTHFEEEAIKIFKLLANSKTGKQYL